MNSALLSGISGLRAHQSMIDVAGNNLANVNTSSFKSSRVSFAELLSMTLRDASQPSGTIGGTNPMQIGSGVQVASVDRNMAQGSLMNTGQPLDMAIEGSGFFALNDGQQDVYTRVGSLAVDSNYYLVDPGTGYRLQRIGSAGVAEGFQNPASNDIRIPYDVALPAKATDTVTYTGNLSADTAEPTVNVLNSSMQYTKDNAVASVDTTFDELDQVSGALNQTDTITVTGTARDGTAVNGTFDIYDSVAGQYKTMGDFLDFLNAQFPGSTTMLYEGQIHLTDNEAGYSQTDINLAFNSAGGNGSIELPSYFKLNSAGGQAVQTTNIDIYDSQGSAHTVVATFVKTTTANQWDLVISSVTGDVQVTDRRIRGIQFLSNGSFGGLDPAIGDSPEFKMIFGNDPTNTRSINVDMGVVGAPNGLSQYGGAPVSTAAATGQDGYTSGSLSGLSVDRDGVLVGIFDNGLHRDVAGIRLATFQNPAGLQSIGNNYFVTSANSGEPVPTQALTGGAGAVRGGALEKSNVDVAVEFVNLIQAQNGFQANARTITVANDMLRELTNLIR